MFIVGCQELAAKLAQQESSDAAAAVPEVDSSRKKLNLTGAERQRPDSEEFGPLRMTSMGTQPSSAVRQEPTASFSLGRDSMPDPSLSASSAISLPRANHTPWCFCIYWIISFNALARPGRLEI
jgi:hypothetical protein